MPHANQFGRHFSYISWGESHGPAIGCVIQGCPAGIPLEEKTLQKALDKRAPGYSPYTSPRKEKDHVQLLSGVFEGKTTGTPIQLLIANTNQRSKDYKGLKNVFRPGHANFTYLHKYGNVDYRGGGRSSARETACRVAAGAVAKALLSQSSIEVISYLKRVGPIVSPSLKEGQEANTLEKSPLFCWHQPSEKAMMEYLDQILKEGDSSGAIVETQVFNLPIGLGEPVVDKLEARLAYGMMSLNASKGFEIGEGFEAASLKGSQNNDNFCLKEKGEVGLSSNHAGGTLGGLSTGAPLVFKVAFKPPSSIHIPVKTVNFKTGKEQSILPSNSGRHDPCVGIRAVPCVEAMTWICLADFYLLKQLSQTTNYENPSLQL